MENKEFKCMVEMFSNSTVCYNDGSTLVVPNEMLVDVLIKDSYTFEFDTIHLFGDEKYIDGIVSNLKTAEKTYFNKNNIKIEVN